MKDFPVFTTEYGVASLVLKEVPYRQEAYITIRSSEEPEALLKECVAFCRMVGAEKIYAKGHPVLEAYPLHCAILEMRGRVTPEEETVAHLWPVTAENVEDWRRLLNQSMKAVDNAGTLVRGDEKEILALGGGYFVHRNGELLGAGWIVEDELKLIAAAAPGTGRQVLHTLLSAAPVETLRLQVASTNARAIRFYEGVGLVKTAEISRWYRIL